MATYVKSQVLAPVQAGPVLMPDSPSTKLYPVAEVYDYNDGDTPEPEAPHVWFASEFDANSWAALETAGQSPL